MTRLALPLSFVAALLLTPALASSAEAVPTPRTWYVSADATSGGDGSAARPFASLAAVQAASSSGDTIAVLPATKVLGGGILLKPDQVLMGSGPSVTALTSSSRAPQLTNSSADRLDGDAVRLADGASVRNVRIVDAHRGAVYGRNVSRVSVIGNDVSGQNASCTKGFLIPEFQAPTNLPGVGIPITGGLQNGWAGIMVDADLRQGGTVRVSGNRVHDAECGDGIDVRTSGVATYTATIDHNIVTSLRQGQDFKSLLAIGLQARDSSLLTATLADNNQSNLGNADDLNLAVEGADSEGVFINGVGPSQLEATVVRNTYTNDRGLGGFSANGLEMVTMGDGSRVNVAVSDSQFSGSPGDVIEEGALGTNARLTMTLDRVTAERSTGVGNTFVLPFNNGDCVLAGSLGAGNDIRLKVRDSVLRNCSNNGLSLGSSVVNGTGPTKYLELDVDRTTITGNRGGNIGIRNFTQLDRLQVKVQHSNLAGSSSLGSAVSDLSVEDLGSTTTSAIDLGGGSLGSVGQNCLRGGLLAADVVRYRVSAQRNWWGVPGGPGLLRTLALGGSLDARYPLDVAPAHC